MSDYDQQTAIDFLTRIAMPDGAAEAGGALESMASADIAETVLSNSAFAPEVRPLVERTVAKIAEKQPLDAEESFALEAIIIPDKRPVIDVMAGNAFSTDHPLWLHLNAGAAHEAIAKAAAAVGRVELPGHPSLPYGGTGFVVGKGLLMTNRHVAEIFCGGIGLKQLAFRAGRGAAVDFERRVDGGSHLLKVKRVVMVHPYWDMALLAVEGLPDTIVPLKLASRAAPGKPEIVAIGYPAFDPRNKADVQRQVFRDVYNVKRIMPGLLTGRARIGSFGNSVDASTHDSSTTGGASGSAVFDPATGSVLALHFGGIYMRTNYGVPAAELARDGRVIDAGVGFAGTAVRSTVPWERQWRDSDRTIKESTVHPVPAVAPASPAPAAAATSFTIPLTITVSLGAAAHGAATVTAQPAQPQSAQPVASDDADVVPVEATVADYSNREGYDPDFLGEAVPLPEVVDAADDILSFDAGEGDETVLKYQHFSVQMSRSRRMCFYSAVNIDGGLSRKSPRTGWRLDPRIPARQQIINECYGNPPKFSRGHMTRREDPVWGDQATADRGNVDSMHVTNTTPQMQAFNSPIWLALEDYALEHARRDAMKISVFTGPYFTDDDPTMYGVRIPVKFWKVIAFIHDRTGKLCATGYEMSQQANLPGDTTEFVFGQFRSRQLGIATQTSLRQIEARSGLSFGDLVAADPKSRIAEAAFGEPVDIELGQMEQIVFVD